MISRTEFIWVCAALFRFGNWFPNSIWKQENTHQLLF
ncbi:MAG: hypothetical protein BWY09_00363 [Candidatus Hydrogenedentes bacterium ADurb.Bin179]|nr:MAG: hypothetical protein BWY09_00363 [Candidatus Hydrogenedentes bacterium ADurb.Bin179]